MLKLGCSNLEIKTLRDFRRFTGWVYLVYSNAISEAEHKSDLVSVGEAQKLRRELARFNKLVREARKEIVEVDYDAELPPDALLSVRVLVSLYT